MFLRIRHLGLPQLSAMALQPLQRKYMKLYSQRITVLGLSALIGAMFVAPAAHAQSVGFGAAGAIPSTPGGTALSIGVAFDVQNPSGITITSLGVFDAFSDGLSLSHPVALFSLNASGNAASVKTLLTTVTVPDGTVAPTAGTGALGTFRFADLSSPVFLPQGSHAAVVAYGLNLGNDPFGNNFDKTISGGAVTWSGFDPFAFDGQTGTNPSYPTGGDSGGGIGHASASFLYTVGRTSATPEPGSLTLLGMVALPILGMIRRRKV